MTAPNQQPNKMFDDDPFGQVKQEATQTGLTSRQVNELHKKSDKDSSPYSQHHTLGTDRNQSASGSHNHGGKDSKLVGDGLNLAISGTKNTAASEDSIVAMLRKVISFTDGRT
jgi:hypothetical protein